jgi:excisionase family DNA binding protein
MATDTETAPTETAATPSPWLTPHQAAARAQCGINAIYSAIRTGKLRAVRLGARLGLRVHESWVDAWLLASPAVVNPDAPGADVPLPTPFRRK